jgi:hypothetical protein
VTAKVLNLLAFAFTVLGSGLGVWGALKQANAYYPFRPVEFANHLRLVLVKRVRKGKAEALQEIHTAAHLGEKRGENRALSLVGLYLVFCGFFLNLLGAALAFAATLAEKPARQ